MIQAVIVFSYLAVVLYIGIFAFRGARGAGAGAEDYFLAGRSLGPAVFLLSLFGTNMTAFTILGSAGHAFTNGILTFGLIASCPELAWQGWRRQREPAGSPRPIPDPGVRWWCC